MVYRHLLPREHGSWAMLLVPFFTAAVAGGFPPRVLLALAAVLLLFLSRGPLIALLRRRSNVGSGVRRGDVLLFATPLVGGGALFLWLFIAYSLWLLIPLGLLSLFLFAVHTLLALRRRDRTAGGELLGALALTTAAPVAYYVCRGRLDLTALALWLLNFLYFGLSVFYVKMKVAAFAEGERLSLKGRLTLGRRCLVYLALLLGVVGVLYKLSWVPGWTAAVFAPVGIQTLWGVFTLDHHLQIRRLGFIEAGHSLIFALLLIGAFRASTL